MIVKSNSSQSLLAVYAYPFVHAVLFESKCSFLNWLSGVSTSRMMECSDQAALEKFLKVFLSRKIQRNSSI